MPIAERGGPTTQAGILFQNSIAALFLGRLCDSKQFSESEQVVEVRVEAPESVDDFVVTYASGAKNYFQVKEQIEKTSDAWKDMWKNFVAQYLSGHFRRNRDVLILYSGTYVSDVEKVKAICERASTSYSHNEWIGRLSQDQNAFLHNHIVRYLIDVGSENEIFHFLKHIAVEITTLREIERTMIFHWMPTANISPQNLFRNLRDRVGGAARLRGTFVSEELKQQLQENQIEVLPKVDIEQLRSSVRQCGSLLRQYKNTIGNTGIHISRSVTGEVVQWLLSEQGEKSLSFLLDQAGQGKTVLMRDILETLEREDVQVLGIKTDQQLSGITNMDEFHERLQLPDRIEKVLGMLASTKRTVVLLDQVDALSMSLSQDQHAINLLIDLVARIQSIPGIRVLMSCRVFDFYNDPRFKNMEIEKKFQITDLNNEELSEVLSGIGVDLNRLPETTRHLIRVPLHLDLFMRAVEGKSSEEIMQLQGVSSLQELYHSVWDSVVMKTAPDAPPVWERNRTLMFIADSMNRSQSLVVPNALLMNQHDDDYHRSLSWLASEGILVENNRAWSFFHQTFFDYCYAKNFVENNNTLVESILSSEQGLFQRPQLIQVLSYLRGGTDKRSYYQQISALFQTNGIRYHLRDHFFRWYGAISNPDENEWRILQQNTREFRDVQKFLRFSRMNSGWFPYWSRVLPSLLSESANESESAEEIFSYLYSMFDHKQQEIIEILIPFRTRSEEWKERISNFILNVRTWKTPEAVQWLEESVQSFSIERVANFYRWEDIGTQQPRALIRILTFFLNKISSELQLASRNNRIEAFDGAVCDFVSISSEINKLRFSMLSDPFLKVSKTDSQYFLECIMPWFEMVLKLTGNQRNFKNWFPTDDLSNGWYDEDLYETTELIVKCIRNALLTLSEVDEQLCRYFISQLSELEYQTAQRLVAIIFREKAERFSNDAFQFLLGDNRRLSLGELEVFESRQLIKNIYPYLSRRQQLELEKFIMNHNEIYAKPDMYVLRNRGIDQLRLLRSIQRDLLSSEGKQRIMELERKFPHLKESDHPRLIDGGWVESPVPNDRVVKLNDKNWLRAMERYQRNVRHEDFLKGGASELARLLREQVVDQPERFYRLSINCSIAVDHHYVNAFLMGLSESNAPLELLVESIRKFKDHEDRIVKLYIARALEKRHSQRIPTDLLLLLKSAVMCRELSSDTFDDPLVGYHNTIRGESMNAYMKAMQSDISPNSTEKKWDMIKYAVDDDFRPLRAGAIVELIQMLPHDAERSISLFENALIGTEELYDMNYTKQFCYRAVSYNCRRMLPHINKLMCSKEGNVQEIAASIVTHLAIGSFNQIGEDEINDARVLFANALFGSSESMKIGIAKVLSKKITSSLSQVLFDSLRILIQDEQDEVHRNISTAFYRINSTHIESSQCVRDFISEYAGSRAVRGNYNQFENMMWEHGRNSQEWSLRVYETLLANEHYNAKSMWGGGESLIRSVLNIYNDILTPDHLKEKAMNVFDRLMELFSHEAQKVLSEWDQR